MSASLEIMFLDTNFPEKPQVLSQIVQVFIAIGFRIDELNLGGTTLTWKQYHGRAIEAVSLAGENRELSFRAFNSQWGLEFRGQVVWGEKKMGSAKRAWIRATTDNTPYFWRVEYDPSKYSDIVLGLGRNLYHALHPTFGWIDFDYGLRTTYEDIESFRLPALYWANYFGPAYVHRIGADRIVNAPAWRIEPLDDGGIVYVLAECPGLSENHVPTERVKSHFNIDRVR